MKTKCSPQSEALPTVPDIAGALDPSSSVLTLTSLAPRLVSDSGHQKEGCLLFESRPYFISIIVRVFPDSKK